MNPPRVNEDTTPRSHNITRIIAIVVNMFLVLVFNMIVIKIKPS